MRIALFALSLLATSCAEPGEVPPSTNEAMAATINAVGAEIDNSATTAPIDYSVQTQPPRAPAERPAR